MEVDRYHYNKLWEIKSADLLPQIYPALKSISSIASWFETLKNSAPISETIAEILDLRTVFDFDIYHLPGAISKPLVGLTADTLSPFFDTPTMEWIWPELMAMFSSYNADKNRSFEDKTIVLICYNGDVSRIATSILRAHGIEAVNLMDGMDGLITQMREADQFEKL